jgi:hypothetical protein
MKNIYKIDLAIIVVSLIVLMALVGYVRPMVISPLNGYETSDTEILFSIEKADSLLIDDNLDFTTPDEYLVEDGMKINLQPGTYYWKALGVLDSDIRTLTIKSEVNLELREIEGDGYGVVNVGNVRLNVDVYNGTELVDQIKLGVDDEVEAEGTDFVGGQDDK